MCSRRLYRQSTIAGVERHKWPEVHILKTTSNSVRMNVMDVLFLMISLFSLDFILCPHFSLSFSPDVLFVCVVTRRFLRSAAHLLLFGERINHWIEKT